ncbi:hypothetical protein EBB07_30035 [Paenibacillaceae bacterium]|nr:hypothetical protein EBB07_30035 [Paenibacillaceae bacterium]
MTVVSLSGVTPGFFLLGVVFILLVFGLLSFGILRMFQLRFRTGWFSFAGAVASGIIYAVVLDKWYL